MMLFNLSSATRFFLIAFAVLIICIYIFVAFDSIFNISNNSIKSLIFSVFITITMSIILLELAVVQTSYAHGIIMKIPDCYRYILLIDIIVGIIILSITTIEKKKISFNKFIIIIIGFVAIIFMMPFFNHVIYYVIGLSVLTITALVDLFYRLKKQQSIVTNKRIKLIIQNLDVGIIVFNKKGYISDFNDKFKEIIFQEEVDDIDDYHGLEKILKGLESNNLIFKFKAGLFQVNYHYNEDRSFYLIFVDVTNEVKLSQELEKLKTTKSQDIEALNKNLASADELYKLKTRSALALKAHDKIGQIMTILGLAIDLSLAPDVTKEEVNQKLLQANKALESISHSNLSETSFREMIDNFNESFKYLNFEIIVRGTEPSFVKNLTKISEEILSEIINNAIKHDSASKLYIDCNNDKISITNNGSSKVVLHAGMGLKGMKEKLAAINLNLEIKKYNNGILLEISPIDKLKEDDN